MFKNILLFFLLSFLFLSCSKEKCLTPPCINNSYLTKVFKDSERYKYRSRDTTIILALEIGGVTKESLEAIDSIYIIFEDETIPCSTTHYLLDKDDNVIYSFALFGIPRNATELKLGVGKYPLKLFKVEGKIYDELSWEDLGGKNIH